MRTWAEAFALQAASDLNAYEALTKSGLPQSHSLHYLQMWLEKLCKSYIHQDNIESLRYKHEVVEKILPRVLQENWKRMGFKTDPPMKELRELCAEIDRLHPRRPDQTANKKENAEYPWPEISGEIAVPCFHKFRIQQRLYSPAGRLLLRASKILTQAN